MSGCIHRDNRGSLCDAPVANRQSRMCARHAAQSRGFVNKFKQGIQQELVSAESMRRQNNLRPTDGLERWKNPPPTWRTVMCVAVAQGRHCPFGHTCHYAHSKDHLRHLDDPFPAYVYVPRRGVGEEPPALPQPDVKAAPGTMQEQLNLVDPSVKHPMWNVPCEEIEPEQCSICYEDDKFADRRWKPCGHMVCSECMASWRSQSISKKVNGTKCHLCRTVVVANEALPRAEQRNADNKKKKTRSVWADPEAKAAAAQVLVGSQLTIEEERVMEANMRLRLREQMRQDEQESAAAPASSSAKTTATATATATASQKKKQGEEQDALAAEERKLVAAQEEEIRKLLSQASVTCTPPAPAPAKKPAAASQPAAPKPSSTSPAPPVQAAAAAPLPAPKPQPQQQPPRQPAYQQQSFFPPPQQQQHNPYQQQQQQQHGYASYSPPQQHLYTGGGGGYAPPQQQHFMQGGGFSPQMGYVPSQQHFYPQQQQHDDYGYEQQQYYQPQPPPPPPPPTQQQQGDKRKAPPPGFEPGGSPPPSSSSYDSSAAPTAESKMAKKLNIRKAREIALSRAVDPSAAGGGEEEDAMAAWERELAQLEAQRVEQEAEDFAMAQKLADELNRANGAAAAAARPPVRRVASENDKWQCGLCTFENEALHPACAMCETPRVSSSSSH